MSVDKPLPSMMKLEKLVDEDMRELAKVVKGEKKRPTLKLPKEMTYYDTENARLPASGYNGEDSQDEDGG